MNFQEWTSCEAYGHHFDNGVCTDCAEHANEYDPDADSIGGTDRELYPMERIENYG